MFVIVNYRLMTDDELSLSDETEFHF